MSEGGAGMCASKGSANANEEIGAANRPVEVLAIRTGRLRFGTENVGDNRLQLQEPLRSGGRQVLSVNARAATSNANLSLSTVEESLAALRTIMLLHERKGLCQRFNRQQWRANRFPPKSKKCPLDATDIFPANLLDYFALVPQY